MFGYRQNVKAIMKSIAYNTRELTWDNVEYPLYLGHRGTVSCAPENTMSAFLQSMAHGIPIETDVLLTKDNVLVLSHDDDLSINSNGTGYITSKTLDEIKYLDFGSKFSAKYANERIPTLFELLQYAGDNLFILELKHSSCAMPVALTVKNLNLKRYVIVSSFSLTDLVNVRNVDTNIHLMKLYSSTDSLSTAIQDCQTYGIKWIGCDYSNAGLTSSFVSQCHLAGIKVFVFTIDSIYKLSKVQSINVDGYFVDDYPYIRYGSSDMVLPYTDDFNRDFFGSGWFNPHDGFTIANGLIGRTSFSNYASSVTLGKYKIPNTPVKISMNIIPKALNADSTRYPAIQLNLQDEAIYGYAPVTTGKYGYHFNIRQNGSMEISKLTSDMDFIVLAQKSNTGNLVVDTPIPIEITIDAVANTLSFKRMDNGNEITAVDSDYRSLFISFLNIGMAAQFSNFSVTAA